MLQLGLIRGPKIAKTVKNVENMFGVARLAKARTILSGRNQSKGMNS